MGSPIIGQSKHKMERLEKQDFSAIKDGNQFKVTTF